MRLLLCRPQGGLNDILNQIEKCYAYAKSWNRLLVVDTAFRNSKYFKDQFSHYFSWQENIVLLLNPFSDELLNSLSVFPEFLQGRVQNYSVEWSVSQGHFVDTIHKQFVTFDFLRDYPHELLVHHHAGGGLRSFSLLQRIQATRVLRTALESRLSKIPSPYPALHIRNTDMKTDYRQSIDLINEQSLSHLFLATDDQEVLKDFTQSLRSTKVFSFSSLTKTSNGTLHDDLDESEARSKNLDAILDLLMLSLARPLFISKVNNNPHGQYSGFSRLAMTLNKSPGVVRRLIGRE